ncbi:DUF2156 domain-containing protein [Wenxinia saemankumensis]|nr:DUF2156 domain-containing protein [Wenxinia saemankumensis]
MAVGIAAGGARRGSWRMAAGLAGLALGLWLLGRIGQDLDLGDLRGALGRVPPAGYGMALLAAAAGLWAMGRLDAAMHRALGTGIAPARAARAATVAVAISQTAGFGLVTGGLARWRALPGAAPLAVGHVTAFASLSFLAAAAALALAARALGAGEVLPLVGLALVGGALLRAGLVRPAWAALWTTALDTALAAAALWLLWGGGPASGLSFTAFYAIFVLAFWTGLVSQSPGGLGVFEAAMIAMLPGGATADLVAALLVWRLVLFALPAILAPLALIRPRPGEDLAPLPASAARALSRRMDDPDWALIAQGGGIVAPGGGIAWHRRVCAGLLMTLGAPSRLPGPADLAALRRAAEDEGTTPLLYRLPPRAAARIRQLGWAVVRVGREARIDLPAWRLDGPERRQLRRKVAAARKAGLRVEIRPPGAPLPLEAMEAIHREWEAGRRFERGLVMGRFAPDLFTTQSVALGWQDERLVAFASFLVTDVIWGLDLMRQRADVPPGTMQGLVVAAIEAAGRAGARTMSLSTLPDPEGRLVRALTRRTRTGLHQFKASFGPDWRPVHAAAPNRIALALGLARLTQAIRWPGRLPPGAVTTLAMRSGGAAGPVAPLPARCPPAEASPHRLGRAGAKGGGPASDIAGDKVHRRVSV